MGTLRFYGFYIKCVIKSQAEYKANFISGIFANIYTYFLTYFSVWIITHRFTSIAGWEYYDLIFLTGLNQFSYSIAITGLFYYVSGLEQYINENKFDIVLLRPIHPVLSMVFDGFAWMGIGQIATSTVFLAYGIMNVPVDWDAYKIAVLILCLIGGVLIQAAALIIFGTLSFWVSKSYALSTILYYNLRSFINYPISIFGSFISIRIFGWLVCDVRIWG